MRKFLSICLLVFCLSVIPHAVYAKTAVIAFTGLTGGTAGDLDNVECEDILGDNTNRAIATGDIAIGNVSGVVYIYQYDSTASDGEASPGIIVPDDVAGDCGGNGQWDLSAIYATAGTLTGALTLQGAINLGTGGVVFTDDGDGQLTITGAGDGSDEDLTLNFDDTADTVVIDTGTSVGTINWSAIAMLTTGAITGALETATDADAHTLTSTEYHGGTVLATGAGIYTLPTAAAGYSGCVEAGQGVTSIIQLLPAASDYIVVDGARGTVNTALASDGSAGDRICYRTYNADDWYVITFGTWAE